MPGASSPSDFARYASYEMNLDLLRSKRSKRLGIKGTNYAGQKRVFSVLERGTRKFPGDMGLWMQYLEFCRHEGSNAKLSKGLTKVLRLQPVRWELWVWGAKYHFEQQGDVSTARSFMQRGLRFCANQREMWVQYLRLEMIYLAKIAARRKILKLDEQIEKQIEGDLDGTTDEVALPTVTQDDLEPEAREKVLAIDDATLKKLSNASAFDGAIAVAITDAGAKTFKNDPSFLCDLFDCVYTFADVPSAVKILKHIAGLLKADEFNRRFSKAVLAIMAAKLQIFAVDTASPEFPPALLECIKMLHLKSGLGVDERSFLQKRAVQSLAPLLQNDLDTDVRQAILLTLKKQVGGLLASYSLKAAGNTDVLADLRVNLSTAGADDIVLEQIGLPRGIAGKG